DERDSALVAEQAGRDQGVADRAAPGERGPDAHRDAEHEHHGPVHAGDVAGGEEGGDPGRTRAWAVGLEGPHRFQRRQRVLSPTRAGGSPHVPLPLVAGPAGPRPPAPGDPRDVAWRLRDRHHRVTLDWYADVDRS